MCADWQIPLTTRWRQTRPPSVGTVSSASSSADGPDGRLKGKDPEERRRQRLNSELLAAVYRLDVMKVYRLMKENEALSINAYCSETKASAAHIATMKGDSEMLQVLCSLGADVTIPDSQGQLPLHLAAWEGNIHTTKVLLKNCPNTVDKTITFPTASSIWAPENSCGWGHNHQEITSLMSMAKTEEGSTALHIASMHCMTGVVEFLIKRGASVQIRDVHGRTALDVAGQESGSADQNTPYSPYFAPAAQPTSPTMPGITTYSFPTSSPIIVPMGSSNRPDSPEEKPTPFPSNRDPFAPRVVPIGMEAVGTRINNALHCIVSTLMDSGAKIMASRDGDTEMDSGLSDISSAALRTAIDQDDVDVMTILIENGASLVAFDRDGDTPLHLAVRKKKFEPLKVIVKYLEAGKIDMKNEFGITALHLAVLKEWAEGIGFLLESRASVEVKSDGENETVLHIAAKLANPKMMEELLSEDGALEVVNYKDRDGFTPLLRAIQCKSLVVVELLIKTAKADVNVHLKDGTNIIHFTVSCSSERILKYLMKVGSCRKLLNELAPEEAKGVAPLHIAAENGQADFVQILLENRATASLRTTDHPKGRATALHLAAANGYRRTIEILLKFDSNCLNIEDKNGWKPLHTACFHGHGKSATTMIRRGADLSDSVYIHGAVRTALDLMVVNVPRCAELLEDLLDEFIYVDQDDLPGKPRETRKILNDPSCAIKLDFEVLLSSNDPSGRQLMFLNCLVNAEDNKVKDIILHPLIEIFLFFKWNKLWKFFAILLFFYFIHTMALTAFCAVIFIQHYNHSLSERILQITFLISLFPIVIAETLQLLRLERGYWNDYESWMKWVMIFTSGTVGYGSVFAKDDEWIRHFSSFAILSSWLELLFLFARFRYWGLDVLMFEKVIENVLTVLSKFVFLFLGFMFALMIHFEGAAPFSNFWDSFCQVVVMVVELNYGGVFSEASTDVNAVIGRLIFVFYLIFVALAMTNLTVGLAVSDIAVLEKQGRVERLIKRTSFLSFLETLVYNERIATCFPPRAKSNASSYRSVEPEITVHPNRPGVLTQRLKNALLFIVQKLEPSVPLTTEHFDGKMEEMNATVEKLRKDIAALQKQSIGQPGIVP